MCDYQDILGDCEGEPEIAIYFRLTRRDTLQYYREQPVKTEAKVCPKHTYELSKDGWRVESYHPDYAATHAEFEVAFEKYRMTHKDRQKLWPNFGNFAIEELPDPFAGNPDGEENDLD